MILIEVDIIENPKKRLSCLEKKRIVEETSVVVSDAFEVPMSEELIQSTEEHVINVDVLGLAVSEKKEIVGLISIKKLSVCDLIYGIAVKKRHQRKRIGRRLIRETCKGILAVRTSNPIIYLLLERECNRVFPSLTEQRVRNKEAVKAANHVLTALGTGLSDFNEETFVIKNAFPEPLEEELPKCSEELVNDWFKQKLSNSSRNAFIFVAYKI